jgi:hypothetical protein
VQSGKGELLLICPHGRTYSKGPVRRQATANGRTSSLRGSMTSNLTPCWTKYSNCNICTILASFSLLYVSILFSQSTGICLLSPAELTRSKFSAAVPFSGDTSISALETVRAPLEVGLTYSQPLCFLRFLLSAFESCRSLMPLSLLCRALYPFHDVTQIPLPPNPLALFSNRNPPSTLDI